MSDGLSRDLPGAVAGMLPLKKSSRAAGAVEYSRLLDAWLKTPDPHPNVKAPSLPKLRSLSLPMRSKTFLTCCGALLAARGLLAQEALHSFLTAEVVDRRREAQLESAPYTVRWHDLRVLVSPSFSAEWRDNINLSDRSPEDDFLLSPGVRLELLHPLGEVNVLKVDVAASYSKYLRHGELDRLSIMPDSAIQFDVSVKDFRFNFHERISYQLDPSLSSAVVGTSEFGGINNAAGLLTTWDLGDITLMSNYDYQIFRTSQDEYRYLDRATHQFLLRASAQVHPAVTVGVEGTASPSTYDDSYLNDHTGYSAGVFARWQVTEHLHAEGRGGYSLYVFTPNRFLGEVENFGSSYLGFALQHTPGSLVSYTLAVDHLTSPGTGANLSESWEGRLEASWNFIRGFPLVTSFFRLDGEQVARPLSEHYTQTGASVGVDHKITEKLAANLSYGFLWRDSELPDRDYKLNRVTLTLSYTF